MEWSGKFSLEEYLALAQDISAEGTTPEVVTRSSFKRAAYVGCAALALQCRSRRKGEVGSTWTAVARDARHFEEGEISAGDGFQVISQSTRATIRVYIKARFGQITGLFTY